MKHLIPAIAIILLLTGLLLGSCCIPSQKRVFYYRDGTVISDSAELYYLERQLPKLLTDIELKESGLHVHTYLESRKVNMERICTSLESTYRDHLRWTHSEITPPDLDSLCEAHQLFEIGIIALKNKTGKIVFTQTNRTGSARYSIFEDYTEPYATALFSFALAMKKHQPHDLYIDANGNESQFMFYHAFAERQLSFSLAQNNNFSGEEANQIVKELLPERRTKKRYGHTPYLFEEHLKLIEIAQIWSLLQQEGIYKKPSVIRSIKNTSGKRLYTHVRQPRRTLDRTTALRMLQLADFRRKVFAEGSVVLPLTKIPPYLYMMYKDGNSAGGTSLFLTPDYTILVVCKVRGYTINSPRLKIQRIAAPIWEQTIQLLRNGKSGPNAPNYIKLKFTPERSSYLFL